MKSSEAVVAAALLTIGVAAQSPSVQAETIPVGRLFRTYYVQNPLGDQPPAGWPLVLSFHGWMGTAGGMAAGDNFRRYGARSAVVVHGEGFSDPLAPGWLPPHRWQSWNGGGSAGKEDNGVDGDICDPQAVDDWGWQCYRSCRDKGYCSGDGVGGDRCRWTHCEDDVAFVLAIVEQIQARQHIDPSRIYATGHSNGGVFVYELASDPRTAGIFAAIVPVAGLPHNGFNRGTLNPKMRFLDIGGTQDTFVWHYPNVPGDDTKSYGICCGWYYSNWRNTTSLWASQKGLQESGRVTISCRQPGFACQGWSSDGTSENADVAACFYSGGHGSPETAWRLVWDFLGIPFTTGAEEASSSDVTLLWMIVAVFGVLLMAACLKRRRAARKASVDKVD